MPSPGDQVFENLRRCKYGALTIYKSSEDHICHGGKAAYEVLVQAIIDKPPPLQTSLPPPSPIDHFASLFTIAPALKSVAIYSDFEMSKLPMDLKSRSISSLINTHLHEHFLRTHPVLAVISPPGPRLAIFRNYPEALAQAVAQCPKSLFAGTCPPGLPHCKPCKPATVAFYRSFSHLPENTFHFATIPHPYTVLAQNHGILKLDPHLIRETRRDDWILSISEGFLERRSGG